MRKPEEPVYVFSEKSNRAGEVFLGNDHERFGLESSELIWCWGVDQEDAVHFALKVFKYRQLPHLEEHWRQCAGNVLDYFTTTKGEPR